jgi:DNA-binding GntR family transcriptional regulator
MGRPKRDYPDIQPEVRIVRSGLHSAAADRLRHMIVSGELSPGEKLVEQTLGDLLGISRTPLRESLKLLATEGLIELVPNRGAYVTRLDVEEVHRLFEVAAGLERLGAELAAMRMTTPELEHLEKLQDELETEFRNQDMATYFTINQKIHQAIVAGSHNDVLVEYHRGLFTRIERARFGALKRHDRWEESVTEHRSILAALIGREREEAGRLMFEHVGHTEQTVTAAMQTIFGDQAAL